MDNSLSSSRASPEASFSTLTRDIGTTEVRPRPTRPAVPPLFSACDNLSQGDQLSRLPNELKYKVLEHLGTPSLVSLLKLNKMMRRFVQHHLGPLTTQIILRQRQRLKTTSKILASLTRNDFLAAFRHFDAIRDLAAADPSNVVADIVLFVRIWDSAQPWPMDRGELERIAYALLGTQRAARRWHQEFVEHHRCPRDTGDWYQRLELERSSLKAHTTRIVQRGLVPRPSPAKVETWCDEVWNQCPSGSHSAAGFHLQPPLLRRAWQPGDRKLGNPYFWGAYDPTLIVDFGYPEIVRHNLPIDSRFPCFVPGSLIRRLKEHWVDWYDQRAAGSTKSLLVKARVIEEMFLGI